MVKKPSWTVFSGMAAILPQTHLSCVGAVCKDVVWEAFANWEDGKTSTKAGVPPTSSTLTKSPLTAFVHWNMSQGLVNIIQWFHFYRCWNTVPRVPCPKYPIGSHKCWNASLSSAILLKTFSGFSLANVEILSGTVDSCLVAFLLCCVCGLPGSVTASLTRTLVKRIQWFRPYEC